MASPVMLMDFHSSNRRALVLQDVQDRFYAVPGHIVEQWRVPDEHRQAIAALRNRALSWIDGQPPLPAPRRWVDLDAARTPEAEALAGRFASLGRAASAEAGADPAEPSSDERARTFLLLSSARGDRYHAVPLGEIMRCRVPAEHTAAVRALLFLRVTGTPGRAPSPALVQPQPLGWIVLDARELMAAG